MRRSYKLDRYDDMIADRAAGMTYRQIGEKYGVTRQRVGQICGAHNRYNFRVIKCDGCVYKNLREWMNHNSVSRSELLQRIGVNPTELNMSAFRYHLRGAKGMSEEVISGLMKETGLSREALFQVG